MQARLLSLAIGVVYVVVGIIGFIPFLHTSPPTSAPHVDATAAYGYLLGIFPVNALHDALHIAVGLLGIAVSRNLRASMYYGRFLFVLFGFLAVLGFMPQANTLWGLVPIFGADTWLHTGTALLGAYIGWVASIDEYDTGVAVPEHAH
jgi:hypothetical protein